MHVPASNDLWINREIDGLKKCIVKELHSLRALSSDTSISQYALIAGSAEMLSNEAREDPRIYYNVSAPSSVFICGSQGSGKSHTLSCILEGCLIRSSRLGSLQNPLTGMVFHYDDYASDSRVSPCEAAYLSSDPSVKVRVLCSPTNIETLKKSYKGLENVAIEKLQLDEAQLDTKRMFELMAFEGSQPLYAQVIQRILREMRLEQQVTGGGFSYKKFLQRIAESNLKPDQRAFLQQRLDTLESFMVTEQISNRKYSSKKSGTKWAPTPGELIIVDLSCPTITAPMACSLFNICLSIFLKAHDHSSNIGRIVALDEAHRYMGDTTEAAAFTDGLLATIRYQRHIGTRIVISTQEPTISPKLLDLCSVTIVHRFTSPDWLRVLTQHLAGVSTVPKASNMVNGTENSESIESALDGLNPLKISTNSPGMELFSRIIGLRTGEALIFAPSAVVGLCREIRPSQDLRIVSQKLAYGVLHVIVRDRITADGGRSLMAE
ncbi:hypothetical protein F5Y16DRAFT_409972 [Xylariaceae sp. FL0255]|nr:hypothetical protein F5Y16DRAFT_409972 [Xylariaceae sp. FL0255]